MIKLKIEDLNKSKYNIKSYIESIENLSSELSSTYDERYKNYILSERNYIVALYSLYITWKETMDNYKKHFYNKIDNDFEKNDYFTMNFRKLDTIFIDAISAYKSAAPDSLRRIYNEVFIIIVNMKIVLNTENEIRFLDYATFEEYKNEFNKNQSLNFSYKRKVKNLFKEYKVPLWRRNIDNIPNLDSFVYENKNFEARIKISGISKVLCEKFKESESERIGTPLNIIKSFDEEISRKIDIHKKCEYILYILSAFEYLLIELKDFAHILINFENSEEYTTFKYKFNNVSNIDELPKLKQNHFYSKVIFEFSKQEAKEKFAQLQEFVRIFKRINKNFVEAF